MSMPATQEDELNETVLSVSNLTDTIKTILETNDDLTEFWVKGEISNFTRHTSGHLYFSIKDEHSQIQCVMFKGKAYSLKFAPKHGDQIILKGSISVYKPRGNYQILVTEMNKAGLGDLHKKFLELKEKLDKEGLFDQKFKKPIPQFPNKIAIITSPTGAALQDILNTIKRRFPCIKLIIAPTLVQGEQAEHSIVKNIKRLNKMKDIDTIILARGGGSLEDLWCFNEEIVAREIFKSNIPLISGVGHETDFTISDFVADLRAPTPSIAAELAVPERDQWFYTLKSHLSSINNILQNQIDYNRQFIDSISFKIQTRLKSTIDLCKGDINTLSEKLSALNPKKVLERGYSVTLKDSKQVKSCKQIQEDDLITTILHDGKIRSKVR